MDYEKAYNEALETARKINNGDGVAAPADWTVCETIFPVLREDYDDMIRGAIIDHLKDNNLTEWADWLEKQGQTFTKKDVDDAYLKGICDAKQELEKQCKQKPVSKVKPKFRIGDVIEVKPMKCQDKIFTGKTNKIIDITEESYIFDDGKAYNIELQDGWKISEQKLAWSEEDERIYRGIHNLIYSTPYCDSRKELSDWLKSLKDRVQLKKEWSEEDKNAIKVLKNIIKKSEIIDSIIYTDSLKEKLYNWLESLMPQNNITDEELAQAKKDAYNDALNKIEYHSGEPTFDDGWSAAIWYLKKRNTMPQSQWKPSDEQMGVIEAVINNRSFQRRHLDSLYEQLKKLREE